MKILLAADNRNRSNWGCRATSMALGGLLNKIGTVDETIDGKESLEFSMSPIPWGKVKPNRAIDIISRMDVGPLQRIVRLAKRKFKIQNDFLSQDPDTSVHNFLRIHSCYPHLKRIADSVSRCDLMVINGEGTYIFTDPPRRDSLFYNFLVCLAKHFGKRVIVANAMMSDCPKTGRNLASIESTSKVLNQCDLVTLRDPVSASFAREIGIVENSQYVPDALFTWRTEIQSSVKRIDGETRLFEPFLAEDFSTKPTINLSEPYICLSGSSSAAWEPEKAIVAYRDLVSALQGLGLPILIVPTCGGDGFLTAVARELHIAILPVTTPIRIGAAILAKAEIFVSGRFHPSILASIGGTPCVFLGSNSHKTRSLQQMLEHEEIVEFPALPSRADCTAIVATVKQTLDNLSLKRQRVRYVVQKLDQLAALLPERIMATPKSLEKSI